MRYDVGPQNALYVHLTLVPYIAAAGEVKTKPTQHSVMKLREIGIQPDVLLCRTDREVPARDAGQNRHVLQRRPGWRLHRPDVKSIYELPLELHRQGIDERLAEILNIWSRAPRLERWERIVEKVYRPSRGEVRIAVVGKYADLNESYKSLNEALVHGGIANDCKVELVYLDSQEVETQGAATLLAGTHGLLVPGGFGVRGTEGKIDAIRWAREKKVPFFGICLGLQMAVVEFARSVLGLTGANSIEFDERTPHPVISLMESQSHGPGQGRHHAAGGLPLRAEAQLAGLQAVREGRGERAPPPPLRGEQRLPRAPGRGGPGGERPSTRSSTWWR